MIKMVTRYIPRRATQIKNNNTRQSIITRAKTAAATSRNDAEFQTTFKKDVNNFILNSSSISDAQNKANDLINTQIRTLEPRLQAQAIASVNSSLNELRAKQNAYISQLKAQIASAEKKAEYYKKRWSKNYKNKSTTWREKQINKETQVKLYKDILKNAQAGNIYDAKDVSKQVISIAKQAGTQARKKELGVRASIISTPKTDKYARQSAIDDIAIQVAQGASVTNTELKEMGLTQAEIQKVRNVEELRGKQAEAAIKKFQRPQDISIFTKKGAEFEKLPKDLQDKVNTYQTLKEIQANAYNVISLKDYSSYGVAKLSDKATTRQIINIIDSYNLPVKDKIQLRAVAKLSDKELKEAILKNKPIANNSIASYNRVIEKYQTNQKKLYSDSLKTLKQQFTLQKVKNITGTINPIKTIYLASVIKYLENQQKKGQTLTYEQVKIFTDAAKKWNTLKNWKREFDFAARYDPNKSIEENKVRTGKLAIKFMASVASNTWAEIVRDVKFISNIISKIPKFTWDITKTTGKVSWETYQDFTKLMGAKISKLSKAEQKKIFTRTASRLKTIQKAGKNTVTFTMDVIKNPKTYLGVVVLAGASAIALGYSGAKKVITSNPSKALGFILSFPIEALITGGTIKAAKLTKAAVSPLVIKGVKVFDGASIRGSAKALKALQGKKVNLFSSTSSDLRKIFKGTDISKADEARLIKDMLKNPEIYIGSNLKIKSLKQIATSSTKRTILQFMKNTKDGILSGSGALKVQLKSFRKVGDFDIIAKNAKSYSTKLTAYLNNTILNRAFKIQRYKVKNARGVYTIYDSFTKKGIADIVDLKRAVTNFGRKITKADVRIIEGVRVFKAESQLGIKAGLISDPLFSFRTAKESKDLKLILKNAKKLLSDKKYTQLRKFLTENDEFLKVRAFADQVGTDRRFSWAKKYFPDLNLSFSRNSKLERTIRARLKKIGFTDRMIDNNIRLYTPTDFYFAPNTVYTEYLRGSKKGGIIFAKNVKISSYPKKLQTLINKNIKGLLSVKEQAKLRGSLRKWRIKNPNKAFVGEKAIADRFGEIEILAPEYTKLFPKQTLLKREIYIPSLEMFVRAQEVTLGKAPKPVLKAFASALKTKLKKGYKFTDMVKDIKKLASTKLKNYAKYLKGLIVPTKSEQKALRDLLKSLDKQEDLVKAARKANKITKTQADDILKTIRKTRKRLDVKAIRATKARLITAVTRIVSRIRKVTRTTKRVTKPVRTTTRITKRVTTPKRTVKRATKPRKVTRVVTRPRTVARTPTRVVTRPRTPIKITKITKTPKRLKLDFGKKTKLKRGEEVIFNGRVRIRGKVRIIKLNTPLNRAARYMTNKVDNTTARSFELFIVGTRNIKDINAPANLIKFRIRKKNSVALTFVEKSQYTIDTTGEKKGLSISKALKIRAKKKTKTIRKSKPKTKNRPTKSKTRTTKSKPKTKTSKKLRSKSIKKTKR